MSETVSIGEIEAIRAKMTPGEYSRGEWYFQRNPDGSLDVDKPKKIQPSASKGHIVSDGYEESVITGCGCCGSPDARDEDAAGLVAEHNAFPVLAAAVKAAIRYIALNDAPGEMNEEHLAKMFAAKDELRAALRKVRL